MTWKLASIAALLVGAGCTVQEMPEDSGGPAYPGIPDNVVAMAAPDQNLATARLRPEDNCYWYEHPGPVETTLLPLRTPNGNPICAVFATG